MLPVTRHFQLGLRAGTRQLPLVALQTAVDLLALLTSTIPTIVAFTLVIRRLAGGLEGLAGRLLRFDVLLLDLWQYVRTPGFLVPVLGVALSGAVLTAFVRLLYLTGAFGVLAEDVAEGARGRSAFMDAVLARFPDAVLLGLLAFFAALLQQVWSLGLLVSGVMLYAKAAGGAAGGAAALALALVLVLLAGLAYDALVRLALIRLVVLGERATAAAYEGARLLLRRLPEVLFLGGLLFLVQLAASVVVGTATGLQGLLPAEAATSAFSGLAGALGVILQVAALALVGVVAQGAFTALVLDDAGRLPPPAPPPQRTPPPPPPVYLARPLARAEVVLPARPLPGPDADVSDDDGPDRDGPDEDGSA